MEVFGRSFCPQEFACYLRLIIRMHLSVSVVTCPRLFVRLLPVDEMPDETRAGISIFHHIAPKFHTLGDISTSKS